MDADRMDAYTGQVDGKTPGQPYEKQWFMRYFDLPDGASRTIRFKRNRFTGTLYVFTRPPEGNRWNERGYGWGRWVAL